MTGRIDIATIRDRHSLSSVAGAVVKLRRSGSELIGCCPFHEEKTPSFTIFDGGYRFHCFGCSASGDVLDFVQHLYRVTLPQAADLLCGGDLPRVESISTVQKKNAETVAQARDIWMNAGAAAGTAVQQYLASRALTLAIPDTIRFARLRYGKEGQLYPCMVALVTDVSGQPTGIQRTYLNAAGTGKAAVPKPKLSLGRVSGGAVRLAHGGVDGLMLTEGVEDALSLLQMEGRAAWAAAGAGMLPAMQLPTLVRSLVIGADADDTGRAAAMKAAARFRAEGRTVRIIFPLAPAKDFNAELQGMRS